MARKMKKFSAGGAQGRYDRRMADIDKDFAKDSKGKSGRALEVLEAKRAQRTADAKDDLAKRTGADRTATRKAEYEAEQRLSRTRKFGADKPAAAAAATPDMVAQARAVAAADAPASEAAKAKPQSFGAAFKEARARLGAGKTFTYNGKSFTTNIAGEGRKASTGTGAGTAADKGSDKTKNRYYVSPENRKAIDAAAEKEPFSKFDKAAFEALKTKAGAGKTVTATGGTALRGEPGGTPKRYETPAEAKARVANLTGSAKRRENLASMFGIGSVSTAEARARLSATREAEKARNAERAKGSKPLVSGTDKGAFFTYGKAAAEKNAAKAKGGTVKKKETTMKYAKGGSTPNMNNKPKTPKTPKEPITGGADTVPLTPERKEFLKELEKRNAKPGMAKGGKTMAKKPAKAKAKPFAATKFGAAMVKKSADTKGRAMVKKCSGGSMKKYASGGSVSSASKRADGCATKGKTKGTMLARGGSALMRSRDSYGGANFKKGGKC